MPTPSANYNVVNAVENDVEIDIPGEEKALFSREDSLVAGVCKFVFVSLPP